MLRQLSLVLAGAVSLFAQPQIFTGGVNNAASSRHGLPSPGIAPGAWFIVEGRDLGPTEPERAEAPTLLLAGTSVTVSSGGQQWDVPLICVSAREIAGRMPAEVPPGEATIAVTSSSGANSEAAKVQIVSSSFSVFTANQSDDAAAVWDQFRLGNIFSLNELVNPPKPGDEVNLWGTGLGAAESIEITVNDVAAGVVNLSRGENGIDRVRIRIPEGVAGCSLGVNVKNGDSSNVVGLLSVAADGAVCLDRAGFTAEDIERARISGGLRTAYLFLLRFGMPGASGPGSSLDIGFANFSSVSYDLMRSFRSNWAQTIPGACYAASTDSEGSFSGQGQPGADFFDDFYPFGETPLDAGAALDVRGPGGPQQMQLVDKGFYTGLFFNPLDPTTSYFAPGDYTLSGSGGEVGSFSADVKIGAPVTWQQLNPLQDVSRGEDLKLTFTGGSPGDRVWVAAYSLEMNDNFSYVRAGIVSCYQLAEKGSVTVPASMLAHLPANSQPGTGLIFLYSMAAPKRFQPSGSGLDAGYVMSLSYSAAPVNFR
jgi:uncharacterized protein (TIGR03437 family)